ncbi:MAG: sulfurtransferase TusA family protein [Rhodospirillales bacterium]
MTTQTLDLTGLACPEPVLKTNRAVKQLIPGETLEVLVTDPDAPDDIHAMCRTIGHEVIACRRAGHLTRISIRRRSAAVPVNHAA